MHERLTHILLLEDNPADARLLQEILRDAPEGRFEVRHAARLSEALDLLRDGQAYDVILLDLTLPDSQGLATLSAVRLAAPRVPVVVLTGLDDEAFGFVAVREGAQDYLVKGRTDDRALVRSIRYAIERHRGDEALRRANRRVSNILESVTDGFIGVDRAWRITYVNREAGRIIRREPESLLGTNLWEQWPYARDTELHTEYHRALADQTPVHLEHFSPPLNAWLEIHAYPSADGLNLFFRDITQRKTAEAALRDSEEKYRQLVEVAGSCILRFSADGQVTFFNESAQRFFGYTEQEVLGRSVIGTILEPRDSAGHDMREMVQNVLRHPERYTYHENENVRRNGQRVWMAWTNQPVYGPDGAIRELLCVGIDMTARKRAEEAFLREHERVNLERRRLQAVLDILPVAVFIIDAQGQISEVNPAAETIWGGGVRYSASPGAYGEDYRAWWPETGRRVRSDEWGAARALATGETVVAEELEIESKDGARRTILNYAVPIRDESGRIVGAVAVNVDITPRKQALDELRLLNETLEQRVAERTAVAERRAAQLQALAAQLTQIEQQERRRLAQLLHDHLQQLLVGAKFHLGAIRGNAKTDERLRAALRQIDGLLDQSIEASRSLTAELSPPILYEAGLAPALEWLARQMGEKYGLQIDLDVSERADPELEELRVLLFQCVRELLFNVVKHSGTNRAAVRMRAADDHAVEILVADEGVGFDPAQPHGQDSGFGLLSIRERLELLGGRLDINTAPGTGARMTLVAPLRLAPQEADAARPAVVAGSLELAARAAEGAPDGGGRIRVLLADDHEIVREGLAGLIQLEQGIQVVAQASDGRMAVELARQVRPDVIVMDVSMPHLNGVEATRQIVQEMPNVRVIGLSMHEEADMAARMREAGAAAFLTKGGAPETLIAAIRGLFVLPERDHVAP